MSFTLTGSFDTSRLPRIASQPVTITVARTVQPGWEAEFLRWADELIGAAKAAHGCLGAAVFHPGVAGGEYQIVVRFANGLLLREWERSPVRNELMDRADAFVTGVRLQRTVGVDEWFEAAGHAVPKRVWWRRLLIDVAWVFPVAMAMSVFIAPWFVSLPMAARVLLGATIISGVVQVVVNPARKRLRGLRRL
jgi:uncharacterized protein